VHATVRGCYVSLAEAETDEGRWGGSSGLGDAPGDMGRIISRAWRSQAGLSKASVYRALGGARSAMEWRT